MKRMIQFLTLMAALLLPASVMAHAGHGMADTSTPAHYLMGVHGLEVMALVLLLVAAIWKLQAGEAKGDRLN